MSHWASGLCSGRSGSAPGPGSGWSFTLSGSYRGCEEEELRARWEVASCAQDIADGTAPTPSSQDVGSRGQRRKRKGQRGRLRQQGAEA